MARKPGRPAGGDKPITREELLACALAIVDTQGVNALSMRRLAAALDVDPMALYHYVPGKEALIHALVERVFEGLRVPVEGDTGWKSQVRNVAGAYRDLARLHPNLVIHLATHAGAGGAAVVAANEVLYAALLGAGLSPRWTLCAADLLIDFINGFVLAESSGQLLSLQARKAQIDALRAGRTWHLPAHQRIFASVGDHQEAEPFEDELAVLLAGIDAMRRTAKGEEEETARWATT